MSAAADSVDLGACPLLTRAFTLLGKRWNALILDVLSQRPARFSEIHRAVPGLSDRVLGERLHELVEAGLIDHQADANSIALYSLTNVGARLVPGLDAIRDWAHHLTREAPA